MGGNLWQHLLLLTPGRAVKNALQTLPLHCDATYVDALERIFRQAPEAVELANAVLFWIVSARRPLTVRELQHMYAVQEIESGESLEQDDLPDEDILTSVCGGLISVDCETHTIYIVHYTAQQYLTRCHPKEILNAKRNVTIASLLYLELPNFSSSAICTTDEEMEGRLQQYPFLEYAAKYWGAEVYSFDPLDDDDMLASVMRFVENKGAIRLTSQVSGVPSSARHQFWSQEFPRSVPALVLAAAFLLPTVLAQMVENGHNVDERGTDGETALIRAAALGHADNVQTLLCLGADVNAEDYMGETAIHRAARNGHAETMHTLLSWHQDLSSKTPGGWTVLMSAVSSGCLEAVRLLVAAAGVDLAAETEWGDSALSMATRSGQEEIANLLADHGAILRRGTAGRRASLVAARRGYDKLVRRLTADYDAVAGRPLQRQTSVLLGGVMPGIQEQIEPTQAAPPPRQPSGSEGADEGDISDFIERTGSRSDS